MQETPGSERRPSSAHPQIFGDAFTADHTKFSVKRTNLVCAVVVEELLVSLDPMLPNEKNCAGNSDVCKSSCRMIKTQVLLTQMILWSLFALVKTDVGVTTSQPPADEKLVELQKTHLCSCGSEKWRGEAGECFSYLQIIQAMNKWRKAKPSKKRTLLCF